VIGEYWCEEVGVGLEKGIYFEVGETGSLVTMTTDKLGEGEFDRIAGRPQGEALVKMKELPQEVDLVLETVMPRHTRWR
jgi:hypothetical protein